MSITSVHHLSDLSPLPKVIRSVQKWMHGIQFNVSRMSICSSCYIMKCVMTSSGLSQRCCMSSFSCRFKDLNWPSVKDKENTIVNHLRCTICSVSVLNLNFTAHVREAWQELQTTRRANAHTTHIELYCTSSFLCWPLTFSEGQRSLRWCILVVLMGNYNHTRLEEIWYYSLRKSANVKVQINFSTRQLSPPECNVAKQNYST